jgi:hypothetical protein
MLISRITQPMVCVAPKRMLGATAFGEQPKSAIAFCPVRPQFRLNLAMRVEHAGNGAKRHASG